MKKSSLKGKANEILTACALVVICIHVSALDSCYMTNALDFSQSEARKFFVCIFSIGNNMISSAKCEKFSKWGNYKYTYQ